MSCIGTACCYWLVPSGQTEPPNSVDAFLHAPECHKDLTVGKQQAGRQAELQGCELAAQIFATPDIRSASAVVAPQRQLPVVDPLVAHHASIGGPQPRRVGSAVDAQQMAAAQPDRRAGLAVETSRARWPEAVAVVVGYRIVNRPIDALLEIVSPADRQEPALAHVDDLLLPEDHILGNAIHDLDVLWPSVAAVVTDQRDRLHAVGVLAVPALPCGGRPEPAPIAQGHHRAA